jgi:hypothetical protein
MAANGIQGWQHGWESLPAGVAKAESALRRLTIAGKPFLVLRQRGRFQDMAYDHGRLLAAEIEEGALAEITATIDRSVDLGSDLKRTVGRAVFRGLTDAVLDAVSDEFRGAAEELAQGYADGRTSPRFDRQQVLDASVAIEVDNLIEGVSRRMQIPFVRLKTAIWLVKLAWAHLGEARAALGRGEDPGGQQTLADVVSCMSDQNTRCNSACTGFSVPSDLTRDGRHLHARTLDADIYRWNRAPVLFLADETPAGGRHRYIGVGTAGLLYPGGISGINDAGLCVSLHQLSTTRFETSFPSGRADIAPFVQQRILRDAGSLGDAIDIIRDTRHFAAWVIFCSDSRTGVSQRYEFNGERIEYGPATADPMAQANHFLDPDLVERAFDGSDGHFTPTFGKWLESRARLALVGQALAGLSAGRPADVDWAIDLLASGRDAGLEAEAARLGLGAAATERSYGRGPRKVYGQLATIVAGDPARRPGHDAAWVSVGDRLPGCMGAYAGWQLDWEALDVAPVGDRPVRRTAQFLSAGRGHWEASLADYLAARVAIARPTDAAGRFLHRAATAAEAADGLAAAEAHLDRAIGAAARDRVIEPPYHFMRARIRGQRGRDDLAKADWDVLLSVWARQKGHPAELPIGDPLVAPLLHPYEAALALALSVPGEDRLAGGSGWPGRAERLDEALTLLDDLADRHFRSEGIPPHVDLARWIDRVRAIRRGDPADVPDPSFVTVE